MEFLIEPDAKGAGASTRLHFVSVIVDILETNVVSYTGVGERRDALTNQGISKILPIGGPNE